MIYEKPKSIIKTANQILIVLFAENANMDETVYCLNSILYQDYPDLTLLVTGDYHRGFFVETLYQAIFSNKKENIKRIWIKLFEEDFPKEKSIEYAHAFAMENGFQYLCCLKDTDAFYQKDSLSLLMNQWQETDTILCGNTIIYDWNNRYCDELAKTIPEAMDPIKSMEMIQNDGIIFGGILYLPKLDSNMYGETLRFVKEIPVLRSRKSLLYGDMNYTASYIGTYCIDLLKKRNFSNGELSCIKGWIRLVLHKKSSIWGCNRSDESLCTMLLELLTINKQENKEERLEKICQVYDRKRSGKIKIVFFCQMYATFPSIKSVYEQAVRDERFEVRLVYVKFYHVHQDQQKEDEGMQDYLEAGYPVLEWKYYDLAKDAPDLAVFVSPYDDVPKGFSVEEVSKVVRRCVYIPYGMTMESHNKELVRLRYQLPMYYFAWMEAYDDSFGMKFAEKYRYQTGNIIPIGNPRSDYVKTFPLAEDSEYIKEITMRAEGRKIVLWNTHHTVNSTFEENGFSAWKLYGEQILNYFKHRKDLFLLWRPHPYFFSAVRELYGKAAADSMFQDAQKCRNILIDRYRSYSAGFFVADFLVSDLSSLVKEFICLGKLIVITAQRPEQIIHPEIKDCCYVPGNTKELFSTIDALAKGDDQKYPRREKYLQQFQAFGKKSIAENILDVMYQKLHQELVQLTLNMKNGEGLW